MSHHDGTCLSSGGGSSTLRVHSSPANAAYTNFSFSPLPPSSNATFYRYALAKAMLALAPGCTTMLASHLGAPNADNGPGTARNLWVGRVDELPSAAVPLDLSSCGCGVALFLGGSGGNTGDNVRYMRQLAAEGYSVVAPDTMAAPAGTFRHRDLVPSLSAALADKQYSYWCANDAYDGGCSGAGKGGAYPACFSSNAANIRFDPAGWAAFYERIYTLRQREVDAVLTGYESVFGSAPSRLFLHGNSEGAMVASRYTHPKLLQWGNLKGRILTAWSCEYNYFVSCEAHAALGAPVVPVLNLLSEVDPFFAASGDSVAASVSAPGPGSYGGALTGSCAAQMRAQSATGAAFKLKQPYHDNVEQGGSFYRMATSRFLRDPTNAFSAGVLSIRGEAMPQTLCEEEAYTGGVLSATCHDLNEYVLPMPADHYEATKCNWKSEASRPAFVDFDRVPEQCVARPVAPAGVAPPPPASYLIGGAVIGVALCAALGLSVLAYMRCACGFSFVRLKEEGDSAAPVANEEAGSPSA